jgi:hypothetical protein
VRRIRPGKSAFARSRHRTTAAPKASSLVRQGPRMCTHVQRVCACLYMRACVCAHVVCVGMCACVCTPVCVFVRVPVLVLVCVPVYLGICLGLCHCRHLRRGAHAYADVPYSVPPSAPSPLRLSHTVGVRACVWAALAQCMTCAAERHLITSPRGFTNLTHMHPRPTSCAWLSATRSTRSV